MQQIWITRYGKEEVLSPLDHELPPPTSKEVQVKVHYAGINFADLLCRQGLYPSAPPVPFVPGYEVSGIINRVGAEVDEDLVGRPVVGLTHFGGYSSEINLARQYILLLKNEQQLQTAAALPVNYFTAYGMLINQAHLQKGEWVLIHGIGGGVGIAALQIAQLLGGQIIGTASRWKHAKLKEMGVEHVIDPQEVDFYSYVREVTHGRGADVILDPIGGAHFAKSYRTLARLGRLVLYGFSTATEGRGRYSWHALKEYMRMPRFNPLKLIAANRGVFGFHLGLLQNQDKFFQQVTKEVMQWYQEGKITPQIDRVFPFSEVQEAHHYLHERRNFGKVLLSPDNR